MTHEPTDQGVPRPAPATTLRSVAASSFLPALVYEIGTGAIAPILVLTALDLGASQSQAALMIAMLGIGRVLGDIPASLIADRIGDRRAMIVAGLLSILGVVGCMLARSLVVMGASLIVIGMSNATFYLARQTYLIDVIPLHLRARAMSTLAGSHRIGLFIGPFVGAGAISLTNLRGAYVVAVVATTVAILFLVVVPDVDAPHDQPVAVRGGVGSWEIVRAHGRKLFTLGLAIFAVGAVRAARQTVLPLWAEHIGLNAETTSLIFGLASAVDMLLFYPSGKIMDTWGRLAVAVPSMVVLGGSMMLMPLTADVVWLTTVAMVMGLGNGFGSGVIMTIGADVAPEIGRIRFLGVWRLFGDVGNAAGPVVVGMVAAVESLAAGVVTVGAIGVLAAGGLAIWVPKYSAFATRRSTRIARGI